MLSIEFQGQSYLFIGDTLDEGGSMTTAEDFVNGRVSYAHLYASGNVMRFGVDIGTAEDISILGPAPKLEFNPLEAMEKCLLEVVRGGWDG